MLEHAVADVAELLMVFDVSPNFLRSGHDRTLR
jgi:hypothetical protein